MANLHPTSRFSGRALRGLTAMLAGGFLISTLLPMADAQGLSATQLPTGKMITPAGSGTQNVGSLPMNMVLTPDGKYALVSDMGFREYLTCLNTATGKLAQPITQPAPVPTDGSVPGPPTSKSLIAFGKPYSDANGLYYGLAIKSNGDTPTTYTVYAAQGANGTIAIVTVGADGSLSQTGTITMQTGDFPAGLSLDKNGLLYVAVNENVTANSLGCDDAGQPGHL